MQNVVTGKPGAASGAAPVSEAAGSVYALLADGSTVEIRPARPEDAAAVQAMHEAMSPENLYLRFFSMSRNSAEREAERVCRPADASHGVLLAWQDGRLIGVASYEPAGTAGAAEVAFAVPDDMHGRGVATLLLEHLVSLARRRGLTTFTASTLLENSAMLGVFCRGRPAGPAPLRLRRLRVDVPAAGRPARPGPGRLPGDGGRPGEPGRRGQPAVPAGAPVGRRGRREPPRRHGGPGNPAQHRRRRFRRKHLRSEPPRPAHGRRALRRLGRGPARARGPGRHRRARRGSARRGRCVRCPRRPGPDGDHLGPGRRRAPTCWPPAAGTACAWSARTAWASSCPAPA